MPGNCLGFGKSRKFVRGRQRILAIAERAMEGG